MLGIFSLIHVKTLSGNIFASYCFFLILIIIYGKSQHSSKFISLQFKTTQNIVPLAGRTLADLIAL